MKRCSYCGGENQDDATGCEHCGTDTFDSVIPAGEAGNAIEKLAPVAGEGVPPPPIPLAPGEVATKWRAKDGWLCLLNYGALVLSFAIIFLALMKLAGAPGFSSHRAGLPRVLLECLEAALLSACVLFFSRVTSFNDFRLAFDLKRPAEKELALALFAGVGLAIIEMKSLYGGIDIGENGRPVDFLTLAALLAPFFEEAFFRGFLYRAFRNSYGIGAAVVIVVAVSLLFHLDRLRLSPLYLVGIGLANLALCVLKERTSSLWNCIAFHLAFNTAMLLIDRRS